MEEPAIAFVTKNDRLQFPGAGPKAAPFIEEQFHGLFQQHFLDIGHLLIYCRRLAGASHQAIHHAQAEAG